jgi:hypothetical protein
MLCPMNLSSLVMRIKALGCVGLTRGIRLSLFVGCNCSLDILMLGLNLKLQRKTDAARSNS